MHKKKIVAFLTMLFVTLNSMGFTSLAAEMNNSPLSADDTVMLNEVEQFMANMKSSSTPRITTCCDGKPSLVWRCTKEWHVWEEGGSFCMYVVYEGDQYCTKCGSVWQKGVKYKMVSGCGQYHYP